VQVNLDNSRLEIVSESVDETLRVGRELGGLLQAGDVVALVGQLGAGKTCLTRGVAEGAGADPSEVTSPTFVLINEYEGRLPVYHFDAYRLSGADDMFALGSEEYFSGDGACLVEWADHVAECLPDEYLRLTMEIAGANRRRISVDGLGERSRSIIQGLARRLKSA